MSIVASLEAGTQILVIVLVLPILLEIAFASKNTRDLIAIPVHVSVTSLNKSANLKIFFPLRIPILVNANATQK
jgi:hypothetical protein